MNRTITGVAAAAGAGAAAMFLFDPTRGSRRRAVLRDKLVRGAHKSAEGIAITSRDLAQRSAGVLAETRARLAEESVPNDVLAARVRSALGRYCSHPRAIDVTAAGGHVTLRGPILAPEAERLVSAVRSVRGVQDVTAELDLHDRVNTVPALQGGRPRAGAGWLQKNWSPSGRVLAGGAGLALMGYCASRRDAPTGLVGTLGFLLFVRAATNRDFGHLVQTRALRPERLIPTGARRPTGVV